MSQRRPTRVQHNGGDRQERGSGRNLRLAVYSVVLVPIGGLTLAACGSGSNVDMSKVHVSASQAATAAAGSVHDGTATDTKLENRNGIPVYAVTVHNPGAASDSVIDVDAATGQVVGPEPTDNGSEDDTGTTN